MSPRTSEMTSNTSIVQKDDAHSTDGENVCNKKKRKMYGCSNCKNYYVSLCGLKKHQQACIQGVYYVLPQKKMCMVYMTLSALETSLPM